MKRSLTAALVVLCIVSLSCNEADPSQPDLALVETVLTHFGFDFSAGISDSIDFTNNDGETIYWMPGGGTNPSYANNSSHIWFRTDRSTSVNETKDMGIVDLSSVTEAPAAWDVSPLIPPLLPEHVIVARCRDGYVKFKVLSTDTTGLWSSRVKYFFSATATFAQ